MRNVKVALETASLNVYTYDASLQLHHKKPGTSVMHRDLTKQVCVGGKTAKKLALAATPSLCNICGGSHTMNACRRKGFPDTNSDVSVK
jgi:DNA polymerase II large subunit